MEHFPGKRVLTFYQVPFFIFAALITGSDFGQSESKEPSLDFERTLAIMQPTIDDYLNIFSCAHEEK